MTQIFDGVAGLLNDAFGATVTHRPVEGAATDVQATFRREPTTIGDGAEGEMLIMSPTVAIQLPYADQVNSGDQIEPGDGITYRVTNRHPSGSPASDAFVFFELEDQS